MPSDAFHYHRYFSQSQRSIFKLEACDRLKKCKRPHFNFNESHHTSRSTAIAPCSPSLHPIPDMAVLSIPVLNLPPPDHQNSSDEMLQWLLDGAAASSLLSAATPIVVVVVVVSAVLSAMTRKSEPAFGTRTPLRLKSTLPILENLVDLIRSTDRMHDWTAKAMEETDFAPFMVRAPGTPDKTILCSPESFEEVFKTHFDAFPKGEFQIGNLRDLLGDGIFAVDGEQWAAQRKTASRLFTMRSLRETMTTTIRKHSVALQGIFERASATGETLDLFNLFNRFTIEAFAEIGFGVKMNCLDSDQEHPFQRAFDGVQRHAARRFVRPAWFWKLQRWLNVGSERLLRLDLEVIDSTVLGIIEQSMAHREQVHQAVNLDGNHDDHSSDKTDIVSLYLDNYAVITGDDSAKSFDPRLLRDVVVNFLIAGRDTTAQALSWFFYCLDRNPRVASKIRDELRDKIPELFDGRDRAPTMEQVGRLVYLEAALRETLRLYPSVPISSKDANRDVILSDGTPVRAGTTVLLTFYAMGRNPHVWGPDAAEYKPERWLETVPGSKEPRVKSESAFKFIAFNAGPRTCLGMNLAMLEMKITVAALLSRFHVALTRPEDVTYEFSVTLPVKGALPAVVHCLAPAAASA